MRYASTFLSHSSVDKPLVEAVARELGRRGILAWLDRNELHPGIDLGQALTEAIRRQATFTVFLSRAAVKSRWVEDELVVALQAEQVATSGQARIIPVYLDDPFPLVQSHPQLRCRWKHPDGDRVDKNGIVELEDDPERPTRIAKKLASGIYASMALPHQSELSIYLDQRIDGPRRGEPKTIPANARGLDIPALVFRPDIGEGKNDETLFGDPWEELCDTLLEALREAITVRGDPRKVRIYGDAQFGIAFLLGTYFDRNTSVDMYCTGNDGSTFTNRDQPRHTPLEGGDPDCISTHRRITPMEAGQRAEQVALLLIERDQYVDDVIDYLDANRVSIPPVWVKHGRFTDNEQVMLHIRNIVALLGRLRSDHGTRRIQLYCGLPIHVVPLLAANLLHVVPDVLFMEYRRDLRGTGASASDTYVPLSFRGR